MNKRIAKREACRAAALVLESTRAGGWETEREGLWSVGSADHLRFEDALDKLITELHRRGGLLYGGDEQKEDWC